MFYNYFFMKPTPHKGSSYVIQDTHIFPRREYNAESDQSCLRLQQDTVGC